MLDAAHQAVLAVLLRGNAHCPAAELRRAAGTAPVRRLGALDGGEDVILAEVDSPCVCGAQNCPYYVLRLGSGAPRVLLETWGTGLRILAAKPLPRLLVRAHESAFVSVDTLNAFDGRRYVQVSSARVRRGDDARKQDQIPLRFAPGTDASDLRGTTSLGWYDSYVFWVRGGRRLTVDRLESPRALRMTLFEPGGGVVDVRPRVPVLLAGTGTYHLHLETDSQRITPYRVRVALSR